VARLRQPPRESAPQRIMIVGNEYASHRQSPT
jgi:hypothetical protein